MTEEEFDDYIQTEEGERHYYEFLFDYCPELGRYGIENAVDNGLYIESFMDHLGVEYD